MTPRRYCFLAIGIPLLLALPLCAGPILLDSEALPDSTPVTTQFPGLVFSNATAITAGMTLNEFEFPPRSGSNVVFDEGGAMGISFTTPALSFGGYFTYLAPLTLVGFDLGANLVVSASALFSNNLLLSGDPGSTPNEFLQVSWPAGLSWVTMTADPVGSSFTLDDVTVQLVPEPATLGPLVTALLWLVYVTRRRPRPQRPWRVRSHLLLGLLACFLAAIAAHAQPARRFENLIAVPDLVFVNTSVTVTFMAAVERNADLITNSVTLTEVDSSGRAIRLSAPCTTTGLMATHGRTITLTRWM